MYNVYENQPPYKSRSTHYSKKLNLYTYQPNLLFLKGNTKGADKLKIFICFKILHVVEKFISKSHQLSLNRILLQLENIFLNLQHFRVDITKIYCTQRQALQEQNCTKLWRPLQLSNVRQQRAQNLPLLDAQKSYDHDFKKIVVLLKCCYECAAFAVQLCTCEET